ncbi:hypothetical protein ACIQRE_01965 [Streptomyces griseoluteus]
MLPLIRTSVLIGLMSGSMTYGMGAGPWLSIISGIAGAVLMLVGCLYASA